MIHSSFALRACALALSAGAHALMAFATFGHSVGGPAPAPAPAADPSVVVDVMPAEEARVDVPFPPDAVAENRAIAPSHAVPSPLEKRTPPRDPSLVPAPVGISPEIASPLAPRADGPAPSPAHFSMRIGTSGGALSSGGAVRGGFGEETGGDPNGAPLAEAGVSVPARMVAGSKVYPAGARARGVEGHVDVEIVVAKDGHVADARVVGGGGHGFDEAALRYLRGAQFSPALRGGQRVSVRMRWPVDFRLTP